MPVIDEHRYRSVRFCGGDTRASELYEPWMTIIVDLDTGQVLGIANGLDSEGVGDWLFAPAAGLVPGRAGRRERLLGGVPQALRTWLPRTAGSVDAFHLV